MHAPTNAKVSPVAPELEHVEAVLVRTAERHEQPVQHVHERPVDVTDVPVVDLAVADRPGDVLEDPLVALDGDQRGAVGGIGHPEEGDEREEDRGEEPPEEIHPRLRTQHAATFARSSRGYKGMESLRLTSLPPW